MVLLEEGGGKVFFFFFFFFFFLTWGKRERAWSRSLPMNLRCNHMHSAWVQMIPIEEEERGEKEGKGGGKGRGC